MPSTKMGLQFGLEGDKLCPKRKNRWLFKVEGVCADGTAGINSLPPSKTARPSIKFRESSVRHLIEDVYYPAKIEYENLKLTLFDLKRKNHPVWEWLKIFHDSKAGAQRAPNYIRTSASSNKPVKPNKFIQNSAQLDLYNGCGDVIESWVFEDVWPLAVDFQDLEMGNSDIVYCDLTLRYVRAYLAD